MWKQRARWGVTEGGWQAPQQAGTDPRASMQAHGILRELEGEAQMLPGAPVPGICGRSPVTGGTCPPTPSPGPTWPRAHAGWPLPHLIALGQEVLPVKPASSVPGTGVGRGVSHFWLEAVTWKRKGVSSRQEQAGSNKLQRPGPQVRTGAAGSH